MKDKIHKLASDLCYNWFDEVFRFQEKVKTHKLSTPHVYFAVSIFWVRFRLINKFL